MSNPIPDGWELSRLDKYVDKFLVPMRDKPKQFAGDTPWVRIEDFGGKYLFRSKANRCVDELTIKTMKLKVYPVGTVLCSCSARLGVCTIAGRPLVSNQTFIGLVPNTSVSSEFLYYRMQSHAEDLQKLSSGTTIAYLPREKFEEFPVLVPPLPEQQKITAILSTVDDVIEKTRAQIDKLKDLKTGMMQELLTKGIGHTQFKDSPVGNIPSTWDATKLSELGTLKNGINKAKQDFGFGVKFVNISDAYSEKIDLNKLNRLNASDREINDYRLIDGDLVFVRSSVKPSGVGYPALFEEPACGEPVLFCGFMIRFRYDQKILNKDFLLSYLKLDSFRSEVMKIATVSANTNINQEALGNLYVAIPPLNEQQKIASLICSVQKRIQLLEVKLLARQNLKKALLQDLLTGKVRVNVGNHQEEKMAV